MVAHDGSENCQSLPEQVEELPAGTVAFCLLPGRQDATLEHQPHPEDPAATHVADVVYPLQVELEPTAATDMELPYNGTF